MLQSQSVRTVGLAAALVACSLTLCAVPSLVVAQIFEDASDLLPFHAGEFAIGATIVDVNADGLADIYRRNSLYLQQPDGSFRNAFEDLGFASQSNAGFGAVFGDTDNNGFVEAFFLDFEPSRPFYLNRAGMRFREYSSAAGIHAIMFVQGSSWLDYDSNGLLDLLVGIDGGVPRLYRNIGLNRFLDMAAQNGFDFRYAYGTAPADYDRDGDSDIIITQCVPPLGDTLRENALFRNDGSGFENVSPAAGITDNLSSWGIVWLDFDNDGSLDFYVGNSSQIPTGPPGHNTLYRNRGDGTFEDVSVSAGVEHGRLSLTVAVAAADFDNDGWVDLFVAQASGSQPSSLYRNNGDATFSDIWAGLEAPAISSQAVAVGDVNGDGWIDIFLPSLLQDQLLLNSGGANHFIVMSLRGTVSNHFGVGARVELHSNGMQQVREITAGDGMTSQNHGLSAHFGLGEATRADSIVVRWPSGAVDRLEEVGGDRFLTIVEGVGLNSAPGPFTLRQPARKSVVSSGIQNLSFAWTRSRDDQDPIRYSLHVRGEGLDSTIADLADEQIALNSDLFVEGVRYRWTVSATDGFSVRGAPYAEFVFGTTTAVEKPAQVPTHLTELHFYPNPSSGRETWISLVLNEASDLTLEVFDVAGRRVARLHSGRLPPRRHRFQWNSQDIPTGAYVVTAVSGSQRLSRMVVLR